MTETDHQRAVRYVNLTGFARGVIREWPPEIARIITLTRVELLEELIRQADHMDSLGELLRTLADLAAKERGKYEDEQ
ncbi:MAG TPA: hypothetical protein VF104_07545 [Burkholderiales bacterium]